MPRSHTDNDHCETHAAERVERIRESINALGYATFTDREIGLPDDFRDKFSWRYFNDEVLRGDVPDIPVDRKRARDVIYYEWLASGLALSEHETILIRNRGNIPGERTHARVSLLEEYYGRLWIEACLSLVPMSARQDHGTFGVNLFRTFTQVVTRPHKDHEEYVIIYVLNKVGDGARSYLCDAASPANLILSRHLEPGEGLIFKDDLFLHGATPLIPSAGGQAHRDALVCTVDYPATYLGETT